VTDAVVVLTTLASEEEAVPFVRMLLDQRLVACGTILPPARSIYRWEGKLADEREVVVLLKTRRDRVEDLQEAFERLHPHAVPELLALPVHAGLVRYLAWINDETAGEPAV
jgi:periplasmic divalent cation tolerance protein